jgi:hypothetical protein
MAEIKVGYRTVRGAVSRAYVDEHSGIGVDKYTSEDVRVEWDGSGWVEAS